MIHFKGDFIQSETPTAIDNKKKKDSYFGIDSEERIQKFLIKLDKNLRKILYDSKQITNDFDESCDKPGIMGEMLVLEQPKMEGNKKERERKPNIDFQMPQS